MLNVRRTRGQVIVSCLACLAMAAASAALAKDDQNANKTPQQDSQRATASQNDSQAANQTSDANPSERQNQQTSQSNQAANQAERGDQADKTSENKQAKSKQGAQLGVGITTDKSENGVLVVRIRPNTAAQKMGLQKQDRITTVNGEKVRSADQFISEISDMSPGEHVEFKVVRNGKERTIRGELEGYSESVVETQGPSGSHEYRQFQSYIDPNQQHAKQASSDENLDRQHEGTQANYENRGSNQSAQSANGDVEARVSRLEQQIEHLTQQLDELVANGQHGQAASAQRSTPSGTATK